MIRNGSFDGLHSIIGLPQSIVGDNGPEFANRMLVAWAYVRGVTHFVSLADAKAAIEARRVDYKTVRPHSSLADRTPD